MGKFLEYWKMAYFNIRMNKVRSFLTMLGIIIGISSVVGILSIGNGFSNWVSGSLNGLVGSYFNIYATGEDEIPRSVMDSLVEKYPQITGYSEDIGISGVAETFRKGEEDITLNAGTPDRQQTNQNEIVYGRLYDQKDFEEGAHVCVIDTYASKKLFGREDAVGEILQFHTRGGKEIPLKVIGIRESTQTDKKQEDNIADDGEDTTVIVIQFEDPGLKAEIPSTVLYNDFGLESDSFWGVFVFVDEPSHAVEMSEKGRRYIEAATNTRGEDKFFVFELSSSISSIKSVLGGITAFVMLVAGISLFVGGVGVMNIMLVSVTERTREIGIRKSLGARTSSILWQFLIEAGMISLMGGIIGILLGYAFSGLACIIAHLVKNTITMTPDFNPLFILGTAAFSMAIGIVFGLHPARKAAKMTPIDALRHR